METFIPRVREPHALLSPQDLLEVGRLCMAVYMDKPRVTGWRPVSVEELGLPESFAEGSKYVNRNAAAFVREALVDGQRTLVVAFKGTDPASVRDWAQNVLGINRHYDLMRPLVDALDAYVEQHGIQRVIAAGHSLGGAMASLFMDEHRSGNRAADGTQYVGCTFGSPGAEIEKGRRDHRLIEFRHTEDIVPRIGRLPLVANYTTPGRIVVIDDMDSHEGLLGPLRAHYMAEYVRTLVTLRKSDAMLAILSRGDDVKVVFDRHGGTIRALHSRDPFGRPEQAWLPSGIKALEPEPSTPRGFGL